MNIKRTLWEADGFRAWFCFSYFSFPFLKIDEPSHFWRVWFFLCRYNYAKYLCTIGLKLVKKGKRHRQLKKWRCINWSKLAYHDYVISCRRTLLVMLGKVFVLRIAEVVAVSSQTDLWGCTLNQRKIEFLTIIFYTKNWFILRGRFSSSIFFAPLGWAFYSNGFPSRLGHLGNDASLWTMPQVLFIAIIT